MPPPAAAAASMARLMAGVSRVLPSPVAPKALTSKVPRAAEFVFGFATARLNRGGCSQRRAGDPGSRQLQEVSSLGGLGEHDSSLWLFMDSDA